MAGCNCLIDTKTMENQESRSLNAGDKAVSYTHLVVMDEHTCMVEVARFFMGFTQRESCGKCGPCRIGTKRMLEILERIVDCLLYTSTLRHDFYIPISIIVPAHNEEMTVVDTVFSLLEQDYKLPGLHLRRRGRASEPRRRG